MISEIRNIFKGKRVVVAGLGRSGHGAAMLLRYMNAHVTVTDRRGTVELRDAIRSLPEGAAFREEREALSLLDGTDMLVVSPGVPVQNILISGALGRGIEVIGEVELAYRAVRKYGIPWIAITGTNGKSTTTALTDLMLKRAGINVLTGGNIGNAITEEIYGRLSDETAGMLDYIVVELSSFQLEGIREFKPLIALILNITPDHLDRYSDMNEYIDAKSRIFLNQTGEDHLILNMDDMTVRGLADKARSRVCYFSREDTGDGAFIRDGWLCIDVRGSTVRIIRTGDIRIRGVHNIENSLAASLAASLCNTGPGVVGGVLRDFPGLEHRMEFVSEIGGVRFYNDSKGTNIGSVIKSLEGFDGNVTLILGGRDKGGDFSPLRRYIEGRVKRVIAIGEARQKIISQLGSAVAIQTAESMQEAVSEAYRQAGAGDTVLLSPGCASFDMFENFEHRGRVFKECIGRLESDNNP